MRRGNTWRKAVTDFFIGHLAFHPVMRWMAWLGVVPALFFPLLAGAQDSLRWVTNYYSITGSTLGEIRQSLLQSRPWRIQSTVDAMTDWRIEWQSTVTPSNGACRCDSFATKTTITNTLPGWRPPTNAPPALTNAWVRYFKALAEHEAGHAQLALAAAAELHQRIGDLGEARDCPAMKKKINDLARQVLDDYRKRDKEYDQRTAHGVKQGAVLRLSRPQREGKRE